MPRPAVNATLSRAEATRFLQRTTFGPRPGDVDRLIANGLDAWLDEQTSTGPGGTHLSRHIAGTYFINSLWGSYLGSPDQFRRRVSYALSQIFVISRREMQIEHVANFADILEANCFGTYRDLLEKVTRSQGMGIYLTYNRNSKADPNRGNVPDENYAREVMQLFSIGLWRLNPDGTRTTNSSGEPIPSYDQDDILGLARVLTGFSVPEINGDRRRHALPMNSTDDFAMRSHEQGEKRFLGTVIPASSTRTLDQSLKIALDTIANHPNVGPFISHQLIQRLVTSNPTPSYVRRVARVFDDDGSGRRGNLGAVVRAVVLDDEAWQTNPPASFGKLREPVLRLTTIARALDVTTTVDPWIISHVNSLATELAQEPYEAPSVFNFYRPGYVPPQTPLADGGLAAPEMQIANETTTIGWVNSVSRFLRRPPERTTNNMLHTVAFGLDPLIALVDSPRITTAQATALTDELVARLCPNGIDPTGRSIVVRRVKEIHDDRYRPGSDDYTTRNITLDVQRDRVFGAAMMIAVSTDFLHER